MEQPDRSNTLEQQTATGSHLLQLGLWLRGALVGVAFAAAGVAALVNPPQGISFLAALTCVAAGATLAWLAWNRATALLDRIDPAAAIPSARKPALLVRRLARAPGSV